MRLGGGWGGLVTHDGFVDCVSSDDVTVDGLDVFDDGWEDVTVNGVHVFDDWDIRFQILGGGWSRSADQLAVFQSHVRCDDRYR